jgi:hypothetical protein
MDDRTKTPPKASKAVLYLNGDDTALPQMLTLHVRFEDLRAAGIVPTWKKLKYLIDHEGFPLGVMLAPNTRAWPVPAIEAWLASRPTKRLRLQGNREIEAPGEAA